MNRIYLVVATLMSLTSITAQTTLPVLQADDAPLSITSYKYGKTETEPWFVNPSLRPDVCKTSAQRIMFKSKTDSITFDIEKDGVYDFVVLRNGRDSAFTRIEWVSDNPLENPPASMLKLAPSGRLSWEQAQFDIDALIYSLNEIHPNMFSVCTQDELMSAVDSVKHSLPDSLSRTELYMAIAPLVAMIGDGHTCLRFPYNDVFTTQLLRIPILFKINTNDYAMSVYSCIDNAIPKEAEVLSINGISTREMLERMMKYESGERDFFRLWRVGIDFPALFQMLYNADEYEVKYRRKGEKKTQTATIAAATWKDITERTPKEEKQERASSAYSFRLIEGKNVAVMDFRSFEDPRKMRAFADSMFTTLRANGIKNLIIDIRYNGGGNSSVGDELFKYISPKPYKQFTKVYVKITPTTLSLLNNKRTPGIFFYQDKELNTPLTAEEGHFDGNVYLLISHQTFSSAGAFSWAFKQFGMGTVIGEESGGMNVSYGDFVNYRLPVSRLLCSISHKHFWQYGADERNVHGTLPDIVVPEAEAMDKAMKLIKRK